MIIGLFVLTFSYTTLLVGGGGLVLLPVSLAFVVPAVLLSRSTTRRMWGGRGRPNAGPRAFCLSAPAIALACAASLALGLAMTLGSLGENHLLSADGRIEPEAVAGDRFGQWAASIPVWLSISIALLLAGALAFAAFTARRWARRRLTPPPPEAKVFYVRDRGQRAPKLRSSSCGRATFAHGLGFQQFESFDDILVRHATEGVGALEAAGPAGDRSGVIVVNAAPDVRGVIEPELGFVRRDHLEERTLLVFPPGPEAEVRPRWEMFRERNGLPPALVQTGDSWDQPPIGFYSGRLLVLRYLADQGWIAWHSSIRSEWAYAVAIREALTVRSMP